MHSDNNIALGFRSAPRDCSIAGAAVLLISGSSLFGSPLRPSDPRIARIQIGLLELAQMFQLPVINSRMVMPQGSPEMVFPSTGKASAIEMLDRTSINLFHCTRVRQRVESLGRRILLLCGAMLEVDVQLTAMTALKRGFVVHVLVDACAARSPSTESATLLSLAGAGVYLSTLHTLAGQLLADVTDPSALPVISLLKRLELPEATDTQLLPAVSGSSQLARCG
jgi:hypothetical protein